MSVILDGTSGITTPGLTNTGSETVLNLTTSGNTILGDTTTDTLNVGAGGLVKDSSGNVGIGTASPTQKLDVYGNLRSSYPAAATYVSSVFENQSSTGYSQLVLNVGASGANGQASISYAPGIFFAIGPTANDTTSPLVFRTSNATERMRINAGAPILCLAGGNTSATGTGIAFPATQSASSNANTLDDYEEGTWTPTDQSGASLSLTIQGAGYIKIGRLVYLTFYVSYPSNSSSAAAVIGGLPFASAGSPANVYGYFVGRTANNIAGGPITWQIGGGSNALGANYQNASTGAPSNANLSGSYALFSGCYYADN